MACGVHLGQWHDAVSGIKRWSAGVRSCSNILCLNALLASMTWGVLAHGKCGVMLGCFGHPFKVIFDHFRPPGGSQLWMIHGF